MLQPVRPDAFLPDSVSAFLPESKKVSPIILKALIFIQEKTSIKQGYSQGGNPGQ
jgi:hypothetical protein